MKEEDSLGRPNSGQWIRIRVLISHAGYSPVHREYDGAARPVALELSPQGRAAIVLWCLEPNPDETSYNPSARSTDTSTT